MISEALANQIGENVDALITLDLPSYGVIGPLYAAARAQHGAPISLLAAGKLRERLPPGSCAVISTGLILPGHYPYGETDGPVGAAVLARALALGLKAKVLVVTDPELCPLQAALLRQAELQVVGADAFATENGTHRAVACVLPHSRDAAQATAEAAHWLERFPVGAVIAIEKCGANAKGVYHMVGGTDISAQVSQAVTLFAAARQRKILTIGIGDRGNEIGFGPIVDTVRALLPKGSDCGCPCGGGVADHTQVDVTLPATISNWGAYGVAACLAALGDMPDLIQSPQLEMELLKTAVREGGVDGMSGRAIAAADGIDAAVHVAVVTMLHEVYRAQSARNPSPFSTPLISNK